MRAFGIILDDTYTGGVHSAEYRNPTPDVIVRGVIIKTTGEGM